MTAFPPLPAFLLALFVFYVPGWLLLELRKALFLSCSRFGKSLWTRLEVVFLGALVGAASGGLDILGSLNRVLPDQRPSLFAPPYLRAAVGVSVFCAMTGAASVWVKRTVTSTSAPANSRTGDTTHLQRIDRRLATLEEQFRTFSRLRGPILGHLEVAGATPLEQAMPEDTQPVIDNTASATQAKPSAEKQIRPIAVTTSTPTRHVTKCIVQPEPQKLLNTWTEFLRAGELAATLDFMIQATRQMTDWASRRLQQEQKLPLPTDPPALAEHRARIARLTRLSARLRYAVEGYDVEGAPVPDAPATPNTAAKGTPTPTQRQRKTGCKPVCAAYECSVPGKTQTAIERKERNRLPTIYE
eukprot:Protomagalhaensia_sp_Gyna_25__1561@NODE_1802_length_1526_cov_81_927371_g1479_i0_p1_GENE_NODE_1802_length_1526_cov_81_927371_g1479_i0NODE_1802_length_1526_cov_81_927371_g1479_i0_p1_ORF_typecomplete_len357_score31_62MerRDNAbind/PF09278_11/33MerRDNAbind/PF09278_11/11_NODE_1802_length_1526_cov_81_927371_g1479_i03011371